jgi:hypothetical protein
VSFPRKKYFKSKKEKCRPIQLRKKNFKELRLPPVDDTAFEPNGRLEGRILREVIKRTDFSKFNLAKANSSLLHRSLGNVRSQKFATDLHRDA